MAVSGYGCEKVSSPLLLIASQVVKKFIGVWMQEIRLHGTVHAIELFLLQNSGPMNPTLKWMFQHLKKISLD